VKVCSRFRDQVRCESEIKLRRLLASFPIRRHPFGAIEASGPGPLPIAHRRDGWLVPMEIRPDINACLAADPADETWIEIGEPNIIRPCDPR
jgi:hypothetical protein